MAAPTLSTTVSRRSMLAGGMLAVARPDMATGPAIAPDPDAEIFRRLAAPERCWAARSAAQEAADRLFYATYRHPEFRRPPGFTEAGRKAFDAVAERTGYRAAARRYKRLNDRYLATAREAFDLPAHGLPGIAAKLRFGVAVAREGVDDSFADNAFEWLDLALDDFERLARVPARETG